MTTYLQKTPESAGISSASIERYLRHLEAHGLATHNVLLSRGDDIVFARYWKPFDREFCHRMYSVTKSIVSLAIGFLVQDGKISLEDRLFSYFPAESAQITDANFSALTIRNMLRMATTRPAPYWFHYPDYDRVALYFQKNDTPTRPQGSYFEYDSFGSFILGALVERVSGQTLLAYCREKFFDAIGVSDTAAFLTCPGGHSWGDSALVCRPEDLWRIARFTMNYGAWDGKQLLNRAYVQAATTKQIDTPQESGIEAQGYGYQIWMGYGDAFFFNGMGCQFALCVPSRDVILIYNGDNQGNPTAKDVVLDGFFELVLSEMGPDSLPEAGGAARSLDRYARELSLFALRGAGRSPLTEAIHGREFSLSENPMGITRIRFTFCGDGGVFSWTNAQGDKSLPFGFGYNAFAHFPQEGYSDDMGGHRTKNFYYRCAASAEFPQENTLHLYLQVIDRYFGNAHMVFTFDGDTVRVEMKKTAEDFLNEYQGSAVGTEILA